MDKIFTSEGNGFLGSHLTEKAIKEGSKVTVLDDITTSNQLNVPADANTVKGRAEDASIQDDFEYIVHLAARPSPKDYLNNHVETLISNSVVTLNLLKMTKRDRSRIIYKSSSEVDGNGEILPIPESYYGYVSSWEIRSCYDEGKRYSEALIMAYNRKFSLDTRKQRPFNVYGHRIRPDRFYGRVVPTFIQQALTGDEITIYDDGKLVRSFLYVEDWIDATWRKITMDDLDGDISNIGSSDEITIFELANLIVKKVHSSSKILHVEKRDDNPGGRSSDITKAKKLLGWRSETGLDTGLYKTIDWIRGDVR